MRCLAHCAYIPPLLASHRQVFISEQQLYTGRELERHMKGGDVEGPMAAAGFKGHPECRCGQGGIQMAWFRTFLHLEAGEMEGPRAAAGFKGHPECQ